MSQDSDIQPYDTIECCSYKQLLEQYEKLINHGNIWLFRGQSNSKWSLLTSFERDYLRYIGNEEWFNTEKNEKFDEKSNQLLTKLLFDGDKGKSVNHFENSVIREFKRKADIYTKTPKECRYLEWISLMRHYLAPVRLLDCTYSFYIALYQAIKDAEGNCAIYAFNQKLFKDDIYNHIFKNGKITSLLRDSSFELDSYMEDYFNKNCAKGVINVTPFRHNVRIAIQQGSFLMNGNLQYSFIDNLRENIKCYNLDNGSPVLKFILSYNSEERRKIIGELFRMNVTSHSLNPTLEGFCETLKVRFII